MSGAATARNRVRRAALEMVRHARIDDLFTYYDAARLTQLAREFQIDIGGREVSAPTVKAAFVGNGMPRLSTHVVAVAEALWTPDLAPTIGKPGAATYQSNWLQSVGWLWQASRDPLMMQGATRTMLLAAALTSTDRLAETTFARVHQRMVDRFSREWGGMSARLSSTLAEEVAIGFVRLLWGACAGWIHSDDQPMPYSAHGLRQHVTDAICESDPSAWRLGELVFLALADFVRFFTVDASTRVVREQPCAVEGTPQTILALVVLRDLARGPLADMLRAMLTPARLKACGERAGDPLDLSAVGRGYTRRGTRESFDVEALAADVLERIERAPGKLDVYRGPLPPPRERRDAVEEEAVMQWRLMPRILAPQAPESLLAPFLVVEGELDVRLPNSHSEGRQLAAALRLAHDWGLDITAGSVPKYLKPNWAVDLVCDKQQRGRIGDLLLGMPS